MSILVTGSTGLTGREVVRLLAAQGAPDVRALTRSPQQAGFPAGVTAVPGALSDVNVLRAAMEGVSTLFLLAPNVDDELQQTLLALNVAREAGVRGIVYLSVFQCERHPNVPHFACKVAAERMIEALQLPATILRPAFFMQNDLRLKDALLGPGIYAHPVGDKGMAYVDIRDIAEVAVKELLRRASSPQPLPPHRIDVVGPDNLDVAALTGIWSRALGRHIKYGTEDLDAFERLMAQHAPAAFAYDLKLMFQRFQQMGSAASPAERLETTQALGRPSRSYADFVAGAVARWGEGR